MRSERVLRPTSKILAIVPSLSVAAHDLGVLQCTEMREWLGWGLLWSSLCESPCRLEGVWLYPLAAQGSPVLLERTLIKPLVHQAGLGMGGVSLVCGCLSGVIDGSV